MSVQAVRELINRQNAAATSLAALGVALDARVSGAALDPDLAQRVGALLSMLGGEDLLESLTVHEARAFLAEIRLMLGLDLKLLSARTRAMRWNHVEPEILEGVGEVSAAFVQPLARMVVPGLDGLDGRLTTPGAAVLDVGVGVAGLAIAVAWQWPAVRVVGIDPWQPALALGRDNVRNAGLEGRIELREQRVEDLADTNAFDLGWLPVAFMPRQSVLPGCRRVLEALRPGGWMLVNALNGDADPVTAAHMQLRFAMLGDGARPSDETEELLRAVGAVEVQTLSAPPGAFLCLVAARRERA